MSNITGTDFMLEKSLKELSPDLHQRFTDMVFALQNLLSNYKLIFPEYTDYSEFHILNVINFCNKLIGINNIHQLTICLDQTRFVCLFWLPFFA